MDRKTDAKTRRVAQMGLLFALSCALSIAESMLTGWMGLPPGVKPGLANVVVMLTLFFAGGRPALVLVALKAAFGALTRGLTAGFLSACGGLLSLAVLWLLHRLAGRRIGTGLLSVCGALAHNAGQLLGVGLWLHSPLTLYYLPVLLLSAVGCGLLSGAAVQLCGKALQQRGVRPFNTKNENNSQ